MSLRSKMLAGFLFIIVVFSAMYLALSFGASSMVFGRYEIYLKRQITGQLQNVLISYYVKNGQSWEGVYDYVQPFLPFKEKHSWRPLLALLDEKGQPVAVWPKGAEERWRESGQAGSESQVPVILEGREIGWLSLPAGQPMGVEGIRSRVSSLLVASLLISVLISFITAFVISYILAGRISKPLMGLSEAARRVGRRRFDLRLPVTSNDEIGVVVRAFNEMSEELQRSEQARHNLVADVAHELRTPLTVMQGQLESIQQGIMTPSAEALLPVHDEVIRLNRLVDDLRQLTLAEAGKLPLNRIPTNVTAVIRKIADNFQWEAEARGIELRVGDPEGPLTVPVDPDRFTQIVVNILGNALNYTPRGGRVTMGSGRLNFIPSAAGLARWCREFSPAGREGGPSPRAVQSPENNGVVVWVADQGPGIDPDHLPFVFDRFYRVDQSRERSSGGVGLGLAIAREFVMAHGGRINACNLKGGGSLFAFFLPAARAAGKEPGVEI